MLLSIATVTAAESVKSQWRSADAKVDGQLTEWTTLTSVTKEVTVGAANDRSWLHLLVSTSDAQTRQRFTTSGLIVYLDPAGKKDKSFGIRIPPMGGMGRGMGRGARGASGQSPPPDADPNMRPRLTYVEVIGPEKNQTHIVDMTNEDLRPLDVVAGDETGTLVLELAIPLRPIERHPYSVNLPVTQAKIGLGLVTPDVPTSGRGEGRGMPGRGGGGMGGGGRGGPSGGPDRGGPDADGMRGPGKGLNAWTTVELAHQD